MNNLDIESTINTPAIHFHTDGKMLLEGRSLTENITKFYRPLIEWTSLLKTRTVTLDINLKYFNSSSAKKILELLIVLDTNSHITELTVNWHFERDDEDALESGQIIEELMKKAVFKYYEYVEAA